MCTIVELIKRRKSLLRNCKDVSGVVCFAILLIFLLFASQKQGSKMLVPRFRYWLIVAFFVIALILDATAMVCFCIRQKDNYPA